MGVLLGNDGNFNSFQSSYCNHIGVKYMHINDADEVKWLRERFEKPEVTQLQPDQKKVCILCKFV